MGVLQERQGYARGADGVRRLDDGEVGAVGSHPDTLGPVPADALETCGEWSREGCRDPLSVAQDSKPHRGGNGELERHPEIVCLPVTIRSEHRRCESSGSERAGDRDPQLLRNGDPSRADRGDHDRVHTVRLAEPVETERVLTGRQARRREDLCQLKAGGVEQRRRDSRCCCRRVRDRGRLCGTVVVRADRLGVGYEPRDCEWPCRSGLPEGALGRRRARDVNAPADACRSNERRIPAPVHGRALPRADCELLPKRVRNGHRPGLRARDAGTEPHEPAEASRHAGPEQLRQPDRERLAGDRVEPVVEQLARAGRQPRITVAGDCAQRDRDPGDIPLAATRDRREGGEGIDVSEIESPGEELL